MSEDAVTESEARRLLGAAAATIEVDGPAPLTLTGLPEPRRHRRWSALVAVAACVVLVAGAAWVVARQLGDGRQVPPEPAQRPSIGERRSEDPAVRQEPSPARSAATDRFIRWARNGQSPPRFADRVRRMTGGFSPPWVDEPTDRARWSGCSGLGFPDCGIDPVARIFHTKGELQVEAGLPGCGHDDTLPPAYRAAASDVVRVSGPGTACDGWYVLLWIDEGGAIYGVM